MRTLEEDLATIAREYPVAARVTRAVLEAAPSVFSSQIDLLRTTHAEEFWARADRIGALAERLNGKPVESIVEYTYQYIREQVQFMQTGAYSNTDFDEVMKAVYSNPAVMQDFYLEGLLMTHAYWPIHFEMHRFFERGFLPKVPDRGEGAEFGFGHGLYLAEVLEARPKTRARGFDVSEFSCEYAARLLALAGIERSRYELGLADVRKTVAVPDGAYEWAVFAEIVEHIPDPLFSLRELHRTLKPGAPAFVTTVIDSNTLDHIYQFESVEAVEGLLSEAGFATEERLVLRAVDFVTHTKDPTVGVAMVCRRR